MSDLTPSARALLESARSGYAPSAGTRVRVRDEILRRAAATAAAPEAPSSGVRFTLRAHGGKLLGASLVALAAGMFAIVHSSASEPAAVTPGNVALAAPVDAPSPAAETLTSPHQLPEAPIAAPAVPSTFATSTSQANAPRKVEGARGGGAKDRPTAIVDEPPAGHRPAADSLGAEMRLVGEGQTALKAGNLALARRDVDEHARSFPHGHLREERLVLDVLLLCAEGQTERARRKADELVTAYPRSSHLEVLRGSCAGSSSSTAPSFGD
jgi:hypothetical protein